ncbi:MAG: hypothetical protein KAJ62_03435, partial [Desulfobacteraceae bacterium]|nr:hypothetical protein [Desulfobacteraceae bacterium]
SQIHSNCDNVIHGWFLLFCSPLSVTALLIGRDYITALRGASLLILSCISFYTSHSQRFKRNLLSNQLIKSFSSSTLILSSIPSSSINFKELFNISRAADTRALGSASLSRQTSANACAAYRQL